MSKTIAPTMALSSSYIPRNPDGSRPASPALSSSYRPRPRPPIEASGEASPAPGTGSRLKHEVKEAEIEKGPLVLDEATLQNARDILATLSAMPRPAPLATLKTNRSSANPVKATIDTFTDYVHAYSASGSPNESNTEYVKLVGLGLELGNPRAKRQKLSPSEQAKARKLQGRGGDRTPTLGAQRPGTPRRISNGNKNGNGNGDGTDWDRPMMEWSKEKWRQVGNEYNNRAILSKRHGDALRRIPTAKPEFVDKLPLDVLAGSLANLDSGLLFLYSFWCGEQSTDGTPDYNRYATAIPLMEVSRQLWTTEMRRPDITPAQREMNRGMTGLVFLIEAMSQHQMCISQHNTLQTRNRELSAQTSSNHSSTPAETGDHHHHHQGVSTIPSSATKGPSPSGSSTPPPEHDHVGPSPMSSNTSDALPADFIPLMSSVTDTINKANSALQTSRFYLSLQILRDHFPKTYENAMSTDLSELALPVPGDTIGSGRCVDPDEPNVFAWPIELGMSAGIPHLVAFGRSMIDEYAKVHNVRYSKKINPL